MQLTLVVFTGDNETIVDIEGRTKIYSNDVRKVYECLACRARYIYQPESDRWVSG